MSDHDGLDEVITMPGMRNVDARDRLVALVYQELRRRAAA
jgi:hypothetical protein